MISFRKKYAQLDSLASAEEATLQNDDLKEFPVDLDLLDSRLGRAGILNRKAQRRYIYRWICSASFGFVAILLAGVSMEVSPMLLLASVFVLGYLFLLAFLLVLRSRSLRFERDILFALPMVVLSV